MQLTFKRYEIKYQLTEEQCDRLMQAMSPYMVPDQYGPSTVCNVYYDTPSSLLIRRSLEKPLYKEKVRVRSYGTPRPGQDVFLELKKKSEGVVYKRRATMSAERAELFLAGRGDPQNQIERELDFSIKRYGGLIPATYIAYDRVAFYAADDHEFRMTFDRRVRYRTEALDLAQGDAGTQILPDGKVLLEVKCAGAMPLWLVRFLSEERIFKTSFSKYGTAYQTCLAHSLRNARSRQVAPAPERVFELPAYGRPAPAHLRTAVA
ncbi:MAG: polyphosphate polymerase domain-containing protein [Atopobiaceae bacterium]|nr:polyphosphate polymerase domain-containing protein [Atopobiaceae bacterium]